MRPLGSPPHAGKGHYLIRDFTHIRPQGHSLSLSKAPSASGGTPSGLWGWGSPVIAYRPPEQREAIEVLRGPMMAMRQNRESLFGRDRPDQQCPARTDLSLRLAPHLLTHALRDLSYVDACRDLQ